MSENVVRTCRCLPSGTNACTVCEGAWFIRFVGGALSGLWLLLQMWIHILGTAHNHLENVKQLIVRKI